MNISDAPVTWRDLQIKVKEILSICGLEAEIEKKILTARGEVEIDVYAIDNKTIPPSTFVIECKNWSTNVPKEKVHALYTVVSNSGANHGLLISKTGFQSGATDAAQNTNIQLLTWEQFCSLYIHLYIINKYILLEPIAEPLYRFTDYFSTTYNDLFFALDDTMKDQMRQLASRYRDFGGLVTRRYGLLYKSPEKEVSNDIAHFYPGARNLEEFLTF